MVSVSLLNFVGQSPISTDMEPIIVDVLFVFNIIDNKLGFTVSGCK